MSKARRRIVLIFVICTLAKNAGSLNVEYLSGLINNLATLKNTELNYISDFERPEQTTVGKHHGKKKKKKKILNQNQITCQNMT
jgi:hypothetical protein